MSKTILFSDLDGTFLDHQSYAPARDAWKMLEASDVPLVFCSSKTFAEQTALQYELGMRRPFIFENGSAIALPRGYFPADFYSPQRTAGDWDLLVLSHAGREELFSLMTDYPELTGFSHADDHRLAEATGLKNEALARACDRWFTETLLSPNDDAGLAPLRGRFLQEGWMFSRGGRFFTLQSAAADKGKALKRLLQLFQQQWPASELRVVAVGDSLNDAPMLAAAGLPFLLQSYGGNWVDMDIPGLVRVAANGPAGFSEVVRRILQIA